jgi:hypothetical protein
VCPTCSQYVVHMQQLIVILVRELWILGNELNKTTTASTHPVALSGASLLGLSWVGISVSSFGKVARKLRLTLGSAISNAGVVTVSELVRASHWLVSVFVGQQ